MSARATGMRSWLQRAYPRRSVEGEFRVAVVGGGLAGVAAACVLAERGAQVVLREAAPALGGRLAAWPVQVLGETQEMDRGFHAFFRHYANLRALLRRIDPQLSFLQPLQDYPILTPHGDLSFAGIPRNALLALWPLVRRVGIGPLDLARVRVGHALEMLRWHPERTPASWDAVPARRWLEDLRFPPQARARLLDVFAHSFFNPTGEMSAAELLMLFHFYFFRNPEGLVFDVLRGPFGQCIWQPMTGYLQAQGVQVQCAAPVETMTPDGGGWRLDAGAERFDAVVLATDVAQAGELLAALPQAPAAWRDGLEVLKPTRPFAVWRQWLDRPVDARRAPFSGTAGYGILDNISVYERFHGPSRDYARRHGGSVIEVHAYGLHDTAPERVRAQLRAGLVAAWPETGGAQMRAEVFRIDADCPAFAPGDWHRRPGVETPFPGLVLAGDYVHMPFPCALMERATASGMLAANRLLAERGVAPEPLECVPPLGLLRAGRAA